MSEARKHFLRDNFLIEEKVTEFKEQTEVKESELQAVCGRLSELLEIEWTPAKVINISEEELVAELKATIAEYRAKLKFAKTFNDNLEADYNKAIDEVHTLMERLQEIRNWCSKNRIGYKVATTNAPFLHSKDVEAWAQEAASIKFNSYDKELYDIVGRIADEFQRLHEWCKDNPPYIVHDTTLIETLRDQKVTEGDYFLKISGYSISTQKFASMKQAGFLFGMVSLRQQMQMGLVQPISR